jgi:phosphatidylserine/phosphatidylglycerophosphate/cardiolipin synthase-like enzyme
MTAAERRPTPDSAQRAEDGTRRAEDGTRLADWFLTAAERGNPATRLDRRRGDGLAWSAGNLVRPLIHGSSYFAELVARVPAMAAGDVLLFTDWRGDPDQQLSEAGHEVSELLCAAARRGVLVRGLVWRSHLDQFAFSEQQNRHLGEEIEAAGGQCLLDMRVRPGGSHHMKLVVLRHPGRPELDVAFIGGIDLCHSRRDDAGHRGDPQHQPMAAVYGSRPPWHDVQAMVTGPAVGDAELVFRERWEDPAPLTRNPLHRLRDIITRQDVRPRPLPPQCDDPRPCGPHAVQLLRTYPYRRAGYSFAPDGERSIARAYLKVLPRARSLIYLEDQYLWSATVVEALARALRDCPDLRLIAVIPRFPDQDGRISVPPNLIGRITALDLLHRAGRDRVAVYGIENEAGTPVYVHAKVCVVDDTWAIVGSDNFNRRSWTHDSELSCAVIDQSAGSAAAPAAGATCQRAAGYAATLRGVLAGEHLGSQQASAGPAGRAAFDAFRQAAADLDAWHAGGQHGPRPPGRLRRYDVPRLAAWTRAWAEVLYRVTYDPDGRSRALRRADRF